MKTKNLLSFTLLFICYFSSQLTFAQWGKSIRGSGNVEKEQRSIDDFSKIHAKGSLDIYITQGSNESVEVVADDNVIEYIKTEVFGDRLEVYNEGNFSRVKKMEVHITVKNLEEISATGSTDVIIESDINASDFELEASGSSDVIFKEQLTCDKLEFEISGSSDTELDVDAKEIVGDLRSSSDLEIDGTVNILDISLSGSSDLEAYGLKVKRCRIDTSGSSDAYITVSDELEVTASGSSDVVYRGDPEINRMKVSGSADVEGN